MTCLSQTSNLCDSPILLMNSGENTTSQVDKPKSTDNDINFSGKTILIAEDEEMNFIYLREILHNTYAKLIWVKDGEQAVNCFLNQKIDLILMDIKMPRMNGLEATTKIREFHKEIPIIAQTAYAQYEDQMKTARAGCTEFLAKPINKQKLLRLLQKYIG